MSWKKNNYWQKQNEWESKKRQYQLYLTSDKWEDKRQEIFTLAGTSCEICQNGKNIQLHHLTYDRLFNERRSDLLVLCNQCHKKADIDRKKHNTQSTFAHWVYHKHGDSWRGKISFLDMALIFAFEVHGIKLKKIKGIFGIEL